jgi:Aconitase A
VVTSLAGPKRPQDRLNLGDVKQNFQDLIASAPSPQVKVHLGNGTSATIGHGIVAIAAITSCTNTSNPRC